MFLHECAAGYTLFVEDEAARANALLSRGDMEGVMVVHLAGRAAEKMVMGEAEVRQSVFRIFLGDLGPTVAQIAELTVKCRVWGVFTSAYACR